MLPSNHNLRAASIASAQSINAGLSVMDDREKLDTPSLYQFTKKENGEQTQNYLDKVKPKTIKPNKTWM